MDKFVSSYDHFKCFTDSNLISKNAHGVVVESKHTVETVEKRFACDSSVVVDIVMQYPTVR